MDVEYKNDVLVKTQKLPPAPIPYQDDEYTRPRTSTKKKFGNNSSSPWRSQTAT